MQNGRLKNSYFFLQNTILIARDAASRHDFYGAKIQRKFRTRKKKEHRRAPEIKKIIL